MPLNVEPWQFDSNCKALYDEGNARKLKYHDVEIFLDIWIQGVAGKWAKYGTNKYGDVGLTKVQSVLDKGGKEHKNAEEGANC